MSTPVSVQHDQAGRRFVAKVGAHEAELTYRREDQTIDFNHTYVPEALRGQGIAEQLCKTAFEYAKAQRLQVIPSCSYVSGAYLKRHPEYVALTASTT